MRRTRRWGCAPAEFLAQFGEAQARALEVQQRRAQAGDPLLNADRALAITCALEKWRPVLEAAAAGSGVDMDEVHAVVEDLGFHAQELKATTTLAHNMERCQHSGQHAKSGKRPGRYTSVWILQAVMMIDKMKSASATSLRNVLHLAMRIAFPEAMSKPLQALLAELPLPGKGTMSKWRFQVDAALMLWSRQRWAAILAGQGQGRDSSAHLLTDGSLQGGREWLLTELRVASGSSEALPLAWSNITNALAAQARALDLRNGKCLKDKLLDPVADLRDAVTKLAQHLDARMAPLAGLGKRRTNLAHKLHALTHQLFLLVAAIAQFIKNIVVSMTTDFGTEALLTAVEPMPLDEFYPAAAPPMDFQEEGAMLPWTTRTSKRRHRASWTCGPSSGYQMPCTSFTASPGTCWTLCQVSRISSPSSRPCVFCCLFKAMCLFVV